MKLSLLSTFILSIFFLNISINSLYAQLKQTPVRTGFGNHRKPRMIYFEYKKAPRLYNIAERRVREIRLKSDSDSRIMKITRINEDSVYLNRNGYLFHDLSMIELTTDLYYMSSDSAGWKVYFPPDSIYSRNSYFAKYFHDMVRQVKKDKFEWLVPSFRSNLITLNVSRLANLEISIAYEARITEEYSFEVETGVQFGHADPMMDDGPLGVYPLYKFHGFTSLTGFKYYFNRRGYIEPLLHYNYLEMLNARSKFQGNGKYHLQSQYRNDLGFSLRCGKITRIGEHMILDGYAGLGIKMMMIHQLDNGTYLYDDSLGNFFWANPDHSPKINEIVSLWPIVNCGIKIGFGF
jgi:hypothetical protein